MKHITKLAKEINNSISTIDKLQEKNKSQLIQIIESNISFEDITGYEILKDKFTTLWNYLKYEDLKKLWKTFLITWGSIEEKSDLIKSIKNELSNISWKEFIWIQMNIDNFHKNKLKEINIILTKIAKLFNLLEEEYNWYVLLYINDIEKLWKSYNYNEKDYNYKSMKITVGLLYEILDNRARKFLVIWQINDFSQLDCCLSWTFSNKYNIGEEKLNNFFEDVSKNIIKN